MPPGENAVQDFTKSPLLWQAFFLILRAFLRDLSRVKSNAYTPIRVPKILQCDKLLFSSLIRGRMPAEF